VYDQSNKTTFDEEQQMKDEAFFALTPLQRWEYAYRMRQKNAQAWGGLLV
jgi:hypothetical protein